MTWSRQQLQYYDGSTSECFTEQVDFRGGKKHEEGEDKQRRGQAVVLDSTENVPLYRFPFGAAVH